MIKVAILGGSGYTGLELLRILSRHPAVKPSIVTSRQYKDKPVQEAFPCLKGHYPSLFFSDPSEIFSATADFFFSCLPHGQSMEIAPKVLKKGKPMVDLSADFRFRDVNVYETWYIKHKAKGFLKNAVYGLPELFREKIKKGVLVANPGCYPTCAILSLAPLFEKGIIDVSSIIIDAKSGVSGAGRTPSGNTSFVEVNEGFKAYNVLSHRHAPEIEETLKGLYGKKPGITFIPHLLPVSRGILSTIYAGLKKTMKTSALLRVYREYYEGEYFIKVYPEDKFPNINDVRGSNFFAAGLKVDEKNKRIVLVSAIDNLTKGASGQAVQNMNIMLGLKEGSGLTDAPLYP